MNVQAAELLILTRNILTAWGMCADDAHTTAALLVETDLRAIDSHGVSMLPMYEKMRAQGTLNMTPARTIVRDTPVMALIDADRGLGHPIAREAMLLACEKASAIGIGMVGVRNSHHFGATGLYAEMAAQRGMLGLVTSSTSVAGVLPSHGAEPLLGTNPIAFAAPGKRHAPFVLDMSTSTVAVNKVKVYALNDKGLPNGWVVDGRGETVRDSAQALALCHAQRDGGLTPLGGETETGGHKGYGLSVMVQLLSSALTGGSFSPIRNREATGPVPHNIGHFFLAIDPRAFRAEGEFEQDVDAVIDVLTGSRPSRAGRPVQVAGEPERAARGERERSGIPMPETLLAQLRSIAGNAGVPYALGAT
ncbi:MAG: malate dehydrogenase [Burkholderiales bacterium]|nr:MAG: malate dehydrogenase [Burkholderiales bacterium]